ncbi:MAG: DUF2442 domain-containing protein [Hyphomicrobiaceae bacterium]
MLPRVIDARHAGAYRVWLRFSDGLSGEIDLADQLWGPIFEPLKSVDAFAKLRVDRDTDAIVWENGADLSPTWLHAKLSAAQADAAAAE